MKKMYVSKEKLNHYEETYGYVSYSTLIDRYISNMVLCNNIAQDEVFNEELYEQLYEDFETLDEETKKEYNEDYLEYYEGLDIYQYYITDCNEYEAEKLRELNNELIVYNSTLDCYILCVRHYGTAWSYVGTNIEVTTEWSEATC